MAHCLSFKGNKPLAVLGDMPFLIQGDPEPVLTPSSFSHLTLQSPDGSHYDFWRLFMRSTVPDPVHPSTLESLRMIRGITDHPRTGQDISGHHRVSVPCLAWWCAVSALTASATLLGVLFPRSCLAKIRSPLVATQIRARSPVHCQACLTATCDAGECEEPGLDIGNARFPRP